MSMQTTGNIAWLIMFGVTLAGIICGMYTKDSPLTWLCIVTFVGVLIAGVTRSHVESKEVGGVDD